MIEKLIIYLVFQTAIVTGYSNDFANGPTRWAPYNNPKAGVTVACPESWKNEVLYIETVGIRKCEDTPREGYIEGKPHIDIYFDKSNKWVWENWGVKRLQVAKITDLKLSLDK